MKIAKARSSHTLTSSTGVTSQVNNIEAPSFPKGQPIKDLKVIFKTCLQCGPTPTIINTELCIMT